MTADTTLIQSISGAGLSIILRSSIQLGEKVAFVGPSGAGKSKAFLLLMRFYAPYVGRIVIDGIDIAEATPENVRARIAIVPQETMIFGASACNIQVSS